MFGLFKKKESKSPQPGDAVEELRSLALRTLGEGEGAQFSREYSDLELVISLIAAFRWTAQKAYLLKTRPEEGAIFANKSVFGAAIASVMLLHGASVEPTFRRRVRDVLPRFDLEHEVDCVLGQAKDAKQSEHFVNSVCYLSRFVTGKLQLNKNSDFALYYSSQSNWTVANTLVMWLRLTLHFDPDCVSALLPTNFVYALSGDEESFPIDIWKQLESAPKHIIAI